MSGLRLIPALSSCLWLMACAHGPVQGELERTSVGADIMVERRGAVLRYQGELTASGLTALRDLAQGRVVQTLVITSSGGEINVGMDFGEWVFARGLSVEVSKYCLSSCANYVFPAAWQKYLPKGAVVAWHGSARQRDLSEQLVQVVDEQVQAMSVSDAMRDRERARRRQAVGDYLSEAIARQDAFFHRIGVAEYITRIGNERYGIDGFYSLSLMDMARFGILNVIAQAGYDAAEATALDMKITRLRLDSTRMSAPR